MTIKISGERFTPTHAAKFIAAASIRRTLEYWDVLDAEELDSMTDSERRRITEQLIKIADRIENQVNRIENQVKVKVKVIEAIRLTAREVSAARTICQAQFAEKFPTLLTELQSGRTITRWNFEALAEVANTACADESVTIVNAGYAIGDKLEGLI